MVADTSWAAQVLAMNHNACFEIEGTKAAKIVLENSELSGCALPRIAGNGFEQVIGNSPALEAALEQVERVAPTDSTVLIQGETGTGKELIAHAIHNLSSRCGHSFIRLNCAAIPLDLLESELFGHERGAFTGAIAQKIGRFELADKGTLFLDEVGDIPLALQPKLLRVLQEQEFERLGSARTHQVNVRLVAATHRDLRDMVKRGEFRSDLYYRLNVFPVLLPPLRARREDIPALVAHFVEIFGRRMDKQIEDVPAETISALSSYEWPGNIRELQNLIERAVILSNGGVLPNPLPAAGTQGVVTSAAATTLKDSERALILQTLEAVGWVIGGPKGAANRLGLKRTTLIKRMQKLGVSRPSRQSSQNVMRTAPHELDSLPQLQ
jgi:transcriptional regulator with GAF, ATPase, and Fis domain